MASNPAERTDKALILVVERDVHVRTLQRYFLEDAGYAVEFAANGTEALERARAIVPRILISEILVPGLDGLSVCRAIKGEPVTAGIIVLIFSILAAEERAREAGADGFLRKPLDEARLLHSVQELLHRHARGGSLDGPR